MDVTRQHCRQGKTEERLRNVDTSLPQQLTSMPMYRATGALALVKLAAPQPNEPCCCWHPHTLYKTHIMTQDTLIGSSLLQQLTIMPVFRATGALALVKLAAPQPDELGFAKKLALEEIGGTNVVVLQQDASQGQVAFVAACFVCLGNCAKFISDASGCCLCWLHVCDSTSFDKGHCSLHGTQQQTAHHVLLVEVVSIECCSARRCSILPVLLVNFPYIKRMSHAQCQLLQIGCNVVTVHYNPQLSDNADDNAMELCCCCC